MRWAPLAFFSVLAITAPAQAGERLIYPPGHAGADQYAEVVPTAAGNAAPPSGGGGSGPLTTSSTHAIAQIGSGRAGTAKLSRLGKDGHAAAALAAANAPAPVSASTGRAAGSGATAAPVQVTTPGGSISSGISHALGGSGGLGVLLPVLLLVTLVAALAFGVARLRRPRPTESA